MLPDANTDTRVREVLPDGNVDAWIRNVNRPFGHERSSTSPISPEPVSLPAEPIQPRFRSRGNIARFLANIATLSTPTILSHDTGIGTRESNDQSLGIPTFYLESMPPLPLSGSILPGTERPVTGSSLQRSSTISGTETLRSGSPPALQASNDK